MNNENVSVNYHPKTEYNPKPYIFVRDLTDHYNDTSAYTKKIRGIELAWKFIEQIFKDERLQKDLNFHDIIKILDEKFNLNMHTYCAMD